MGSPSAAACACVKRAKGLHRQSTSISYPWTAKGHSPLKVSLGRPPFRGNSHFQPELQPLDQPSSRGVKMMVRGGLELLCSLVKERQESNRTNRCEQRLSLRGS